MTIQDFQKVYKGHVKSITTNIDGVKINIKSVANRIELRINGEYKGESVSDFDTLNEIIQECVNEIKDMKYYMNECDNQHKILIENGAKNFTINGMKVFLNSILTGYLGKKEIAATGSEYWYVNGKVLRFSDHTRPPSSKWNFIHPSAVECIDGLLTKEMVSCWIFEKFNIKIESSILENAF